MGVCEAQPEGPQWHSASIKAVIAVYYYVIRVIDWSELTGLWIMWNKSIIKMCNLFGFYGENNCVTNT